MDALFNIFLVRFWGNLGESSGGKLGETLRKSRGKPGKTTEKHQISLNFINKPPKKPPKNDKKQYKTVIGTKSH